MDSCSLASSYSFQYGLDYAPQQIFLAIVCRLGRVILPYDVMCACSASYYCYFSFSAIFWLCLLDYNFNGSFVDFNDGRLCTNNFIVYCVCLH